MEMKKQGYQVIKGSGAELVKKLLLLYFFIFRMGEGNMGNSGQFQ
jgi:hypothetical protein